MLGLPFGLLGVAKNIEWIPLYYIHINTDKLKGHHTNVKYLTGMLNREKTLISGNLSIFLIEIIF